MQSQSTNSLTQVLPGVWRYTLGKPEPRTPSSVFSYQPAEAAIRELPEVADCPLPVDLITGEWTARGFRVTIPLGDDEQVYGLGLQLYSANQRGKKKTLRVNSDPLSDTGDSHAPVPFYATTGGYGVLIDTLRYATIYCGSAKRKSDLVATSTEQAGEGRRGRRGRGGAVCGEGAGRRRGHDRRDPRRARSRSVYLRGAGHAGGRAAIQPVLRRRVPSADVGAGRVVSVQVRLQPGRRPRDGGEVQERPHSVRRDRSGAEVADPRVFVLVCVERQVSAAGAYDG